MATVTKDFRIKSGLVVEGQSGTINGSDIITEDKLTGGNQNGVSVTYNTQTGNVDFDLADPNISISGDASGQSTMTDLGNTDIVLTLDTVNNDVGSFGSTTKIPTFTVNGKGLITAADEVDVATNLSIAGDTGTDSVSLLTDTLTFSGGEGIDVAVTNNTVTVSAEDATTSNKGVASFDTDNFTVTNGAVSSKTITLGSSTLDLGSTTTSLTGLTQLDVDQITIDGSTISATASGGDLILTASGDINVNSNKITNVATPTEATDAANKAYVDAATAGLNVHDSVVAASTGNLDFALFNTGNGPTELDGVPLTGGERVLLKNQTNATQNGVYIASGSDATAWDRAEDYNTVGEVDAGDFVFVQGGTVNGKTGWVQINTITTLGTDPIAFTQFSGAGTYTAGTGLDLNGTEFVLDLSEVDSDELPEGTTNLFFTDQRAINALQGTDSSFNTVDIDSIAKQIATQVVGNNTVVAHSFSPSEYRSAKYLVKVEGLTGDTQISEVLLTMDAENNVAITEYAIVETNGGVGTISALYDGNAPANVSLRVTVPVTSTITVMGTLLV